MVSSANNSAISSSSASDPSGPPVATPPPNASNQTPAFVGQTRISEVLSGIDLKQQEITSNLSSPWGMDFLPDGRLLISERTGSLVIVSTTGQISAPISGLPSILVGGQGGLLDVSLAPDFATSRMIYFSFSQDRGNGKNATAVARARLSTNEASLENLQVIFQQQPAWASSLHFGSRLVWSNAGLLYVTLGERSNPDSRVFAQDINTHLGKVIRINADGTAPSTNPFVGNPDAKAEVWSYGHRNPQSAAVHPVTGDLWTVEHGPRGGDELNRPEAGKNYGWPIITYGIDYNGSPIGAGITSKTGMEQPVYFWDPVIAPAGMTFYKGNMFPSWKGNLFISSMNPGGLVRLMFNGNRVVGEERLVGNLGRVRDVAEASDGALWVITDSGQLVRLTPQ
jgi:aldose sugar dehydrogenase